MSGDLQSDTPAYLFTGRNAITAVTLSQAGEIPESHVTRRTGSNHVPDGELIITYKPDMMINKEFLQKRFGPDVIIWLVGVDADEEHREKYPERAEHKRFENYPLPFTALGEGYHYLVRGIPALDALMKFYQAEAGHGHFFRYDFEGAVDALGLDVRNLSTEQQKALDEIHAKIDGEEMAYVSIASGPIKELCIEPGLLAIGFRPQTDDDAYTHNVHEVIDYLYQAVPELGTPDRSWTGLRYYPSDRAAEIISALSNVHPPFISAEEAKNAFSVFNLLPPSLEKANRKHIGDAERSL